MCGKPGQDGHFCDACIDEMEQRGIDWEMMDEDEMRAAALYFLWRELRKLRRRTG